MSVLDKGAVQHLDSNSAGRDKGAVEASVVAAAATTSVGWTRSLTPSPVRPSYKSGFARSAAESAYPGLWDGMVFNMSPELGNTGLTLKDHGPLRNDGTMPTSVTWETKNGVPCLDLPGTSSHVVTIPVPNISLGRNFVITAKIRPEGLSGTDRYFSSQKASGINYLFFIRTVGSDVQFGLTIAGSLKQLWGPTVTAGQWYSLAIRVVETSSSEVEMQGWVDGVNYVSDNIIKSESFSWEEATYLSGRKPNSENADGQIANVGVWTGYRSEAFMRAISTDPLAPFRQRRFTPTISGAAEAAGWQPYWGLHATRFAGILT